MENKKWPFQFPRLGKEHQMALLAISVFAFLIPSLIRVYYFDFPIDQLLIGIDDWNRYARHAIDIKQHGLLIQEVDGPYIIPAGFLYNYFVAGIFMIFGDYPAVVYVIQSILLGLSVSIIHRVFHPMLRPRTSWALFIALILFAFLDIYKSYTFRLLSENLAIFMVSLFFLFTKKMLEIQSLKWKILSSLTLAISVLVRPNILPFALAFFVWLFITRKRTGVLFKSQLAMMITFILILLLLPLRNYLTADHFTMMPVDGSFLDYMQRINGHSIFNDPYEYFMVYIRRIAYCMGYIPALNAEFNIRPHWFLMWFGVILLAIRFIRARGERDMMVFILFAFVTIFYITLILIGQIHIYGHRMFIPAIPIVLGLAAIGYDKTWPVSTSKRS
ncbi:MAG: glycosyltransferase family 39 protein [Flavobacteriales bacterium]|nr:glycosyltransferase family 39 protein [Flavobacteriales bacterium]